MRLIPALTLALTAAPALAKTPPDMLLVCDGSTLAMAPDSQTTMGVVDNEGYAATGSAVTSSRADVPFTAQLRIESGEARMSLPAFVAPEISSSKGGWYKVKALVIDDRRITGKVVFNFISSSSFEIDRRTGTMTSAGGFHAQCRAVDLSERAF